MSKLTAKEKYDNMDKEIRYLRKREKELLAYVGHKSDENYRLEQDNKNLLEYIDILNNKVSPTDDKKDTPPKDTTTLETVKLLSEKVDNIESNLLERISVLELAVTNVKDEPDVNKEEIEFDWSILPSPHNRYISMDKNGDWFAYSNIPSIVEGVWDTNLNHIWGIPKIFYPKVFKGNWKDSLFENPKHKQK